MKKFCKYGDFGSFGYLLFLFYPYDYEQHMPLCNLIVNQLCASGRPANCIAWQNIVRHQYMYTSVSSLNSSLGAWIHALHS